MLPFGHLGLGLELGRRVELPGGRWVWFLAGCLAPDLLDKSLYYFLSSLWGGAGLDLGLFSSTRTWGHSVLPLVALFWLGGGRAKALVLGCLAHLLLDHGGDFIQIALVEGARTEKLSIQFGFGSDRWSGLFFPFRGPVFPIHPFQSASQHFWEKLKLTYVVAECLGIWILFKAWAKRRQNHLVNR